MIIMNQQRNNSHFPRFQVLLRSFDLMSRRYTTLMIKSGKISVVYRLVLMVSWNEEESY